MIEPDTPIPSPICAQVEVVVIGQNRSVHRRIQLRERIVDHRKSGRNICEPASAQVLADGVTAYSNSSNDSRQSVRH